MRLIGKTDSGVLLGGFEFDGVEEATGFVRFVGWQILSGKKGIKKY